MQKCLISNSSLVYDTVFYVDMDPYKINKFTLGSYRNKVIPSINTYINVHNL